MGALAGAGRAGPGVAGAGGAGVGVPGLAGGARPGVAGLEYWHFPTGMAGDGSARLGVAVAGDTGSTRPAVAGGATPALADLAGASSARPGMGDAIDARPGVEGMAGCGLASAGSGGAQTTGWGWSRNRQLYEDSCMLATSGGDRIGPDSGRPLVEKDQTAMASGGDASNCGCAGHTAGSGDCG